MHVDMSQSLRGCFLIAGHRMRDPHFFKSVVLVVEHGIEGAMGLIINRPAEVTVAEELHGQLDLPVKEVPLFEGGPVEPVALFVVHDCPTIDPDESPIVPGLFMGSSEAVFKSLVCGCGDEARPISYRVFRGYAGWGSGQLEGELARGDWMTVEALPQFVFHGDPYSVWDELVGACCRARRVIHSACDHPEWN